MKCENCKKDISQKVETYSKEHHGKALCFECQKKINQSKEVKETKEGIHTEQSRVPQSKAKAPEGVSPENIIDIKGKQFITHSGLLEVAHKKGLKKIDTMMITKAEAETIVFRATVMMYDKKAEEGFKLSTFVGHGDANKENVTEMILPHKIRMAETRAINRALRLATNIGMCSIDELGGSKEKKEQKNGPKDDGPEYETGY